MILTAQEETTEVKLIGSNAAKLHAKINTKEQNFYYRSKHKLCSSHLQTRCQLSSHTVVHQGIKNSQAKQLSRICPSNLSEKPRASHGERNTPGEPPSTDPCLRTIPREIQEEQYPTVALFGKLLFCVLQDYSVAIVSVQ